MTRSKLVLPVLLALVALAGCGHKRPPAVTTARPSSTQHATTSPLDANGEGQDRALDNSGAVGRDLLSDANGEGGPLTDVRFAYNEASLSDEAKATMDRHAVWIQAHPTIHVRVEGHCDERGTVDYNLALGDKRAQTARDYLVSKGVPASRLAAVSYGKERPLDMSHTEEAHVRNRRAHFAVLQ